MNLVCFRVYFFWQSLQYLLLVSAYVIMTKKKGTLRQKCSHEAEAME